MINNYVKGLEGLRKRRQTNAVDPIPDEILRDVYLKVMNRINDVYVEGTIRYIEGHHKELVDKINQVDIQVNEIWKECNEGEASIEDFKFALASYEALYKQAINSKQKHNP